MEATMGSKVLLADDSVTIQKVVGIIFANEDYELAIVGNGDAALQKAREIKPDVILVDALMPGKSGYEVCQEIRRDPSLRHTALLLMTGAFDTVDEDKRGQSGADDFITKPFESQSLLDVTARLIKLGSERLRDGVPAEPLAAAPMAATQTVATAPAAQVVLPQAPPVDDIWGGEFAASFDQEATAAPPEPFERISPPAAVAPAPVAAKADDDLWGVFDMEAVDLADNAPPVAMQSKPVETMAANDDFFDFSSDSASVAAPEPEAEEFLLDQLADAEPVVEEVQGAASRVDAFGEFDLEPTISEPPPSFVTEHSSIPSEEDFSTISFDEPELPPVVAATPPPAPLVPLVATPVAPPVIQAEPEIPAAPVAPPVAPLPTPPVTPSVAAAVSLDEEQLKALLSKVSRDVIERIVWEIVPDLAESIIREEIRKIKEGVA